MWTFILSVKPEDEIFAQSLDLILDAQDGAEPCQLIVTAPLTLVLATAPADAPYVKQLRQLELFDIPTYSLSVPLPSLPFVKVIDGPNLGLMLTASKHVLTF